MTTRVLTTAEEFEKVCGQFGPCELVRGEVVELSPAGELHSQIVANVTILIGEWARKTKLGRLLSGEAGLVVEAEPDTVRGADVVYVSYKRLPRGKRSKGFFRTPPELVVEVVGERQGWDKVVEKTGEYLGMGVDRVWVVDPDARRVYAFRRDTEPRVFSEADSLADDAILPGFSCTVADCLAE